jgi:hypothetical protein
MVQRGFEKIPEIFYGRNIFRLLYEVSGKVINKSAIYPSITRLFLKSSQISESIIFQLIINLNNRKKDTDQ